MDLSKSTFLASDIRAASGGRMTGDDISALRKSHGASAWLPPAGAGNEVRYPLRDVYALAFAGELIDIGLTRTAALLEAQALVSVGTALGADASIRMDGRIDPADRLAGPHAFAIFNFDRRTKEGSRMIVGGRHDLMAEIVSNDVAAGQFLDLTAILARIDSTLAEIASKREANDG
jgi:hypothetical protein